MKGLRTQKIVTENSATTATEYTYHSNMLTHMKKGSDELHFFYDADNTPAMVEWNGAKYHYLYNQMGDAIGMIDSNGTTVVEYRYDAWGRSLGVSRSLAATLGTQASFRVCHCIQL